MSDFDFKIEYRCEVHYSWYCDCAPVAVNRYFSGLPYIIDAKPDGCIKVTGAVNVAIRDNVYDLRDVYYYRVVGQDKIIDVEPNDAIAGDIVVCDDVIIRARTTAERIARQM